MDRRNTWYRLIFLLLLTSFTTFGQCDNDSIKVVITDSCKKVQMSPKKFTEFYMYKRNLEKIEKEIPLVEETLDSLRKVNAGIDSTFSEEIDSLNAMKSVVMQSYNECYSMLTEVDIENSYLFIRNKELEKKQWRMFGLGAAGGGAVFLILKLLVQ